MKWCWIQGRDQRVRQERRKTQQVPSLCSSPALKRICPQDLKSICQKSFLDLLVWFFRFTHDSLLAKEDVDRGHIFLPGIVGNGFTYILKRKQIIPLYTSETESYRWLQFNEGVIVLLSVGVWQPLDIIRRQGSGLSPVYLFHLCNCTCIRHVLPLEQ